MTTSPDPWPRDKKRTWDFVVSYPVVDSPTPEEMTVRAVEKDRINENLLRSLVYEGPNKNGWMPAPHLISKHFALSQRLPIGSRIKSFKRVP